MRNSSLISPVLALTSRYTTPITIRARIQVCGVRSFDEVLGLHKLASLLLLGCLQQSVQDVERAARANDHLSPALFAQVEALRKSVSDIDGEPAARFLAALDQALSEPELILAFSDVRGDGCDDVGVFDAGNHSQPAAAHGRVPMSMAETRFTRCIHVIGAGDVFQSSVIHA